MILLKGYDGTLIVAKRSYVVAKQANPGHRHTGVGTQLFAGLGGSLGAHIPHPPCPARIASTARETRGGRQAEQGVEEVAGGSARERGRGGSGRKQRSPRGCRGPAREADARTARLLQRLGQQMGSSERRLLAENPLWGTDHQALPIARGSLAGPPSGSIPCRVWGQSRGAAARALSEQHVATTCSPQGWLPFY